MAVWFEGSDTLPCQVDDVARDVADLGAHFATVVARMPGLTDVELVDQGPDSVTIRTNEGTMLRTGISAGRVGDGVVLEFDEKYEAGSRVTTTAHFRHEFTPVAAGVRHRLVISDVGAGGLLGFLYRRLGSSRIGGAVLSSYRSSFQRRDG